MTGPSQVEIAEVIPLLRLPRNLGVFDYLVPSGLMPLDAGQFVEVNFRRHPVIAVVLRTKRALQDPRIHYQPILSHAHDGLRVPPTLLKLAQWMADYYLQSVATVLRSMIPDFPRHIAPLQNDFAPAVAAPLPSVSAGDNRLLEQILQAPSVGFVSGVLSPVIIAQAVTWCFQHNQQVLILVPQVTQVDALSRVLREYLGSAVVVMPDFTQRLASMNFWLGIRSGKPQVVIGTRRAIFSPFSKLDRIFVLDEHDVSFKQWDQNPRYHARDVVAVLAEYLKAGLIYASASLSVESFWQAKKMNALIEYSGRRRKPIELVNLKNEYGERNFSPLCSSLQQRLAKITAGKGLQALLLVNRKGSASFVRCRDCGEIPGCPRCKIPFRYYAMPDVLAAPEAPRCELRCHQCKASAVLPPVCPACGGASFRPVGAGIQKIATLASTAAPGCSVVCFDRETKIAKSSDLISLLRAGRVDILVATRAVFGLLSVDAVPFVAVIDLDLSLQQSDFRATERTYQMLATAREITGEHLMIQTHLPNHPIYHELETADGSWYTLEIHNRESLGYPPFGRLVRLTRRYAVDEPAESEAKALVNILRDSFHQVGVIAEVFEPRRVMKKSRAGIESLEIVIKNSTPDGSSFPLSPYTEAAREIRRALIQVPDSWVIDFDPEEI